MELRALTGLHEDMADQMMVLMKQGYEHDLLSKESGRLCLHSLPEHYPLESDDEYADQVHECICQYAIVQTAPCDICDNATLSDWLQFFDASISLVQNSVGTPDFPSRYLMYDTAAPSHGACRQRIIKLDCGQHCDLDEVQVITEEKSNRCTVLIPGNPGVNQSIYEKEFFATESRFFVEHKEDHMDFEGTVITLVFDLKPTVRRIARFRSPVMKDEVPTGCASWQVVSSKPASEMDSNSAVATYPSQTIDAMVQASEEKKEKGKLGHRQRKRKKQAIAQIPRTPSDTTA